MSFDVGDIEGRLLLDTNPFQTGLDKARAEAAQFAAEKPTPTLGLNLAAFDAQLTDALAKLKVLGSRTVNAALGINSAVFNAQLAEDLAKLHALGASSVDATLGINAAAFDSQIADALAKLKVVGSSTVSATLAANSAALDAALAAAKIELADFAKKVSSAHLGATAAPFWADIARLRAELDAMSPLDISVGVDLGSAVAQIAALRGSVASAQTGGILSSVLGAGAGGVVRDVTELAGGSEGSTGGGILSKLLWGGLSGGGGLAGFGSLGALAGFGSESGIGMGIGVGGALLGALFGGGVLGASALGVGAVGMGTDLSGIGQAANDLKLYRTALKQLNTAIGTYGAGSGQAAAAQAHLNATLATMPKAAQAAIVAASNTASGFAVMFDKVTGEAEKFGAQIINEAMKVGEKFLPTLGKFATENLKTIQTDLQPLFSWLGSQKGGLGIFTNLEKVFQGSLPTGIHALTQGLELFMKTVTIGSKYLGHFVHWLNDFLTRMNGATFSKWSSTIGKLITDFLSLMDMAKGVLHIVQPLLTSFAGLGAAIFKVLGGVFDQIGVMLRRLQPELSAFFGAHFREMVDGLGSILKALVPLLGDLVKWFLKVATPLRQALAPALETVGRIVGTLVKGLGPLITVFGTFQASIDSDLIPVLKAVLAPVGNVARALGGALLNAAKTLQPFLVELGHVFGVLVSSSASALGKVLTELAKTMVALLPAALTLVKALVTLLDAILPILPPVIRLTGLLARGLAEALGTVLVAAAKSATVVVRGVTDALRFLVEGFRSVSESATSLGNTWHNDWAAMEAVTAAVVRWFEGVPASFATVADDIVHSLEKLPAEIEALFKDAGKWLYTAGVDIMRGLEDGIEHAAAGVLSAVGHVISSVASDVGSFLGISSPATATPKTPSLPAAYQSLGSGSGHPAKERAHVTLHASVTQHGVDLSSPSAVHAATSSAISSAFEEFLSKMRAA